MKNVSKSLKGMFVLLGIFAVLLVVFQSNANAQDEKCPWQVRLRALTVRPAESSTISTIGGEVDASNSIVPELDITYFFTKNIAAEIILGVTPHDIDANGTAAGNLGLGDVWLLPPTLTLQYHLLPDGNIRPYVGVGANFTVFFGEDPGVADDIRYDNSFGYSFQAGLDYAINSLWGVNLDVKKLFLNTKAEVDALGTTVEADVDLHPWIIGLGVCRNF